MIVLGVAQTHFTFVVVMRKISTPDGGLFFQKLHRGTTGTSFEDIYIHQFKCRQNDRKSEVSTHTALRTLSDDRCSTPHRAALVTDRSWQVSRSKQSNDCHL